MTTKEVVPEAFLGSKPRATSTGAMKVPPPTPRRPPTKPAKPPTAEP